MYENVFLPVTTLQKTDPDNPGFCKVRYCRHEDVLSFPIVDPVTGVCSTAIQLKPGAIMYMLNAPYRSSFTELFKDSNAGGYYEIGINLSAIGFNAQNLLSVNTMRYHRWVILVSDQEGNVRLIGNRDNGAKFLNDYDTGEKGTTNFRKGPMRFAWQSVNKCPVYTAQAFNITIGGVSITAGKLTLITRFRVGDVGAPMNGGDHLLANAGFANKNLLVIASGYALACDDGSGAIDFSASIERHYYKTLASNTIDFKGNVVQGELIEIYAFEI